MTRHILLGSISLLLAACSIVSSEPPPAEHFYRFEIPNPKPQTATPAIGGLLVVDALEAPAVYTRRAIVYSEDPQHLALQEYHYHLWTDPPPRLLQQALVEYLRQAQMAATVTDEAGRAQWDYRINGRLLRFERLRVAQGWQVAAELELRVDARNGTRPLLVKNYARQMAANGDSMEATVQAFSAAVAEIFANFSSDLRAVLPPAAQSSAASKPVTAPHPKPAASR
ncbi:MAG: ABC-type transport auxiliary lipoprotein family protein [Nevskiales bacterium]